MDPLTFAERAAACSVELSRDRYRLRAGLEPVSSAASIYERYAGLFTRESVTARLAAAHADPAEDGDESGAVGLARFAFDGYLGSGLVAERAWLRERRLTEVLTLESGETVPYPFARARVAAEPHPKRRRDLEAARLDVERALNPARADLLLRERELAAEVGHDDYPALLDRLRRLNLDAVEPLFDWILDATEDLYRRGLAVWLQRLGVPPDEALPADLDHLFRSAHLDPLFPSTGLLPAVQRSLEHLGLDPTASPELVVDAEPRPRKAGRAFCVPISPPVEVVVSLQPLAGVTAYSALLDAVGRAEQLVRLDSGLPFGARRYGDETVLAASGRLFAAWLNSPRWLRDRLGIRSGVAVEHLELSRFRTLYELRSAIAQTRFERVLLAGESGVEHLYADLHEEITGITPHTDDYLRESEAAFDAAVTVRATVFEVQLRRRLETVAGDAWLDRVEGGQALVTFWRDAPVSPAESLARGLGAGGLDAAPLIEDILNPRD